VYTVCICLNSCASLIGTAEELGLKPADIWTLTGSDLDKITEDYTNTSLDLEDLGSTRLVKHSHHYTCTLEYCTPNVRPLN